MIDNMWFRKVHKVVVNVLSLRCNPQERDLGVEGAVEVKQGTFTFLAHNTAFRVV